jgi:hypothetical protein
MAGSVEGRPSIPFAERTRNQYLVIPRPKVEVIPDKASPATESGDRFKRIPSGVEGVELIVEPGANPVFTKKQVLGFHADADRIATYRGYETIFQRAKGRLQRVAERTGFRGISSVRGGYDAQIYPQTERTYDPDGLRQDTGEFHKELIREEGRVEVVLPIGTDEDSIKRTEALARTIALALIAEGNPADEVLAMVSPRVVQRLDEQRLNQLVASGKINLSPTTLRSRIKQWNTPVRQRIKRFTPNRQRKSLRSDGV